MEKHVEYGKVLIVIQIKDVWVSVLRGYGNAVGTVSLAWDHVLLSGSKAKTNGGTAIFVVAYKNYGAPSRRWCFLLTRT
jgi:hypothetical protein